MKKLYLIRHAKSSWSNPLLDDFDRPLNKRGKNNAPFMANLLLEKEIFPDLIISSSAVRARSTAEIFAQKLKFTNSITFEKSLYLTSAKTLLNVLHHIPNTYNTLFLFGHNPELTEFANELSSTYIENIPTCGIVGFEFSIHSWNELCKQNSTLALFEFPKKYKE
jgi:phosphohistidine phosphatase